MQISHHQLWNALEQLNFLWNSGSAAVLCLLFGLDPERPHFYKKWKFDPLGIPCGWPRWLMPNFSPLGNESELGGPHISALQGRCTWTEVSSDPKLVDFETFQNWRKNVPQKISLSAFPNFLTAFFINSHYARGPIFAHKEYIFDKTWFEILISVKINPPYSEGINSS